MRRLLVLLTLIVALFTSCTKFGDPVAHTGLTSIKLSSDTLSLYVGETIEAPVSTNPAYFDKDSLVFKSSDTSVLLISHIGLLTAKKAGVSTITISNIANTLSASALVTVKATPTDSLKLGLIAYYPFDNNAVDSSGNGNNGTISNLISIADRNGKPNSAYYFTGDTDSFIKVKDNPQLRLHHSDFTINAWIKLVHLDDIYGAIIVSKRLPDSGDLGYQFSITRPSDVAFPVGTITFGPGGPYPVAQSSSVLDSATWHMVSVVYSVANHQAKIYRDGVLDGTSATNMTSPESPADFYIGRDNPLVNKYFSLRGALDDIRIYSRGLSDSELHRLFTISN